MPVSVGRPSLRKTIRKMCFRPVKALQRGRHQCVEPVSDIDAPQPQSIEFSLDVAHRDEVEQGVCGSIVTEAHS